MAAAPSSQLAIKEEEVAFMVEQGLATQQKTAPRHRLPTSSIRDTPPAVAPPTRLPPSATSHPDVPHPAFPPPPSGLRLLAPTIGFWWHIEQAHLEDFRRHRRLLAYMPPRSPPPAAPAAAACCLSSP
ncbi:hypothetical protein E2562_009167 [Oryza meyeriana var. granulata]|uniref:Uncharacterized protein n=1 Tax=Oryza meyeriana var. granulata TaxID=110450 RepID=A0A6G1CF40_9ORYZ|nr:hypothetical protein E2562_009167 [Oryza meyeriana var. granulata]